MGQNPLRADGRERTSQEWLQVTRETIGRQDNHIRRDPKSGVHSAPNHEGSLRSGLGIYDLEIAQIAQALVYAVRDVARGRRSFYLDKANPSALTPLHPNNDVGPSHGCRDPCVAEHRDIFAALL